MTTLLEAALGSRTGPLLLDGGMSTTLEDELGASTDHPLWSSHLLSDAKGRQQIQKVHQMFHDAGSDIIQTNTYQMDESLCEANGLSATELVSNAIALARSVKGSPLVALSLGPYGALTSPGSEYSGHYTGPYGPFESSLPDSRVDPSSTLPPASDAECYEDALTDFHTKRLRTFLASEKPDLLAFETVPLLTEVRAIRRAVRLCQTELPYWISFVLPDGICPQSTHPTIDAKRCTLEALTLAALQGEQPPVAIGINCTHPSLIASNVIRMARTVSSHKLSIPWLVLYPDGGLTYDTVTKSWHAREAQQSDRSWADALLDAASTGDRAFAGYILGGCCKSTPSYIAALRSISG
ncbi:uncharacterized protein L969DRAFT_43183 [Mixia osmundae IAM 14324]|uniref:Hcy-binding domain-containing protein n=1 Tax=Mixia osmundae (strain CBS 9802 / IAM 14324 / JCM 22182 / KY 12970) TaxID=764103 RepID=G7EAG9_MIXOS|nr:uncharacterized protein L969DRAFT_43183 [Mixia osmundae IAM 14324]KEI42319.1 hypothetical protein L969DRAFT_43183 [Mixia osmundae IAM 14324]GAA99829.1 hypothetical protein E5Q_06532 [Mixia osmundae IAM 14324]